MTDKKADQRNLLGKALAHACACTVSPCMQLACEKLKRIIAHHNVCEQKVGSCESCRILVDVSGFHAEMCPKVECEVPYCVDIKLRRSIKGCAKTLAHAAVCKDKDCGEVGCAKLKDILAHHSVCKEKKTNSCEDCTQLAAVSGFHAESCQKEGCEVPYCMELRPRIISKPEHSSPPYAVDQRCFCCDYTSRFSK